MESALAKSTTVKSARKKLPLARGDTTIKKPSTRLLTTPSKTPLKKKPSAKKRSVHAETPEHALDLSEHERGEKERDQADYTNMASSKVGIFSYPNVTIL